MEMEDGTLMYTTGRSYDNTVAMAGDHGVVRLQSGWASLSTRFAWRTIILPLCYSTGKGHVCALTTLHR